VGEMTNQLRDDYLKLVRRQLDLTKGLPPRVAVS